MPSLAGDDCIMSYNYDNRRFVLKGVNPDKVDKEAFILFVERFAEEEPEEIVKSITDPATVMLVFKEEKDPIRLMERHGQKRTLSSHVTSLLTVAFPRAILVNPVYGEISAETLQLYFENRKIGGNPDALEGSVRQKGEYYIVTFWDHQGNVEIMPQSLHVTLVSVTQEIIKRPHHVGTCELLVKPYYLELDSEIENLSDIDDASSVSGTVDTHSRSGSVSSNEEREEQFSTSSSGFSEDHVSLAIDSRVAKYLNDNREDLDIFFAVGKKLSGYIQFKGHSMTVKRGKRARHMPDWQAKITQVLQDKLCRYSQEVLLGTRKLSISNNNDIVAIALNRSMQDELKANPEYKKQIFDEGKSLRAFLKFEESRITASPFRGENIGNRNAWNRKVRHAVEAKLKEIAGGGMRTSVFRSRPLDFPSEISATSFPRRTSHTVVIHADKVVLRTMRRNAEKTSEFFALGTDLKAFLRYHEYYILASPLKHEHIPNEDKWKEDVFLELHEFIDEFQHQYVPVGLRFMGSYTSPPARVIIPLTESAAQMIASGRGTKNSLINSVKAFNTFVKFERKQLSARPHKEADNGDLVEWKQNVRRELVRHLNLLSSTAIDYDATRLEPDSTHSKAFRK